jgi:hypothetical protein
MKRREFIAGAMAGGGALWIGSKPPVAGRKLLSLCEVESVLMQRSGGKPIFPSMS